MFTSRFPFSLAPVRARRFRGLALAALLALAAIAPLGTQAQSAGKIGVVDMEAVTQRSQKIKANVARAQEQVRPQQDEIDSKMREWGRLRQDLSARRSVMKDSEIATQEGKIRDLREEIDQMRFDVDKRINRLQDEVLRPEVQRIMKIIEQIAKREGYSVVLPVEQVLYSDESVDLTALVIQAVDRGEGASSGSSPAPAAGDKTSSEKTTGKTGKGNRNAPDSAESAGTPKRQKGQ